MDPLSIGNTMVGTALPVFFIAEIGVNHNGNIDLAHKLIDEAHAAGARSVKFQSFSADRIVTRESPKAAYQLRNTSKGQSQYEMLKALEVPEWWYPKIMKHCSELGLEFLSTPYDIEDIVLLQSVGVSAFKVPSAWAIDLEYLEFMARTGKPILLSTGMCTVNEVARAVGAVRKYHDKLILLQCTTDYPTEAHECNVNVVKTLSDTFDCLSGLSDHSRSHLPAVMAVALGAVVIERHFTLDKSMPGPDHSSSDTPDELASLVESLKEAQVMLGSACKRPTVSEFSNLTTMRRSIVAKRHIRAGTEISHEDLSLKRPARGIEPRFLKDVVGRKARRDIDEYEHLQYDDVDLDETLSIILEEVFPGHEADLTLVFSRIHADGDEKTFHLHALDRETAKRICENGGRDYCALVKCNGKTAGYTLLRGWEEGYDIPTVGIYILPEFRGKGLSACVLESLVLEARQRCASKMMAKVYRDNLPSLRAFQRAGYSVGREEGNIVYFYASIV
jgi:N-acetylneuraminate synthase/N,N'-diacetyllegionaminate synthase